MNSEFDYLNNYNLNDYERPSVTADIVVFTIRSEEPESFRKEPKNNLSLLLIKRGQYPYKDQWALPGGFLAPGETIEQCALREIEEEPSVIPTSLMSVGMFSEPGRDPRGWIISNAFVSIISSSQKTQRAGDDAADAQWFKITETAGRITLTHGETCLEITGEKSDLAFDHGEIIKKALSV